MQSAVIRLGVLIVWAALCVPAGAAANLARLIEHSADGVVVIPSEGAILDQRVAVTSDLALLGGRLLIRGVGGIDFNGPGKRLTIAGTDLQWRPARQRGAEPANAVRITAGSLAIRDSSITVDAHPEHQPSEPRAGIAFQEPPAWLIRIEPGQQPAGADIEIARNRAVSEQEYGSGFVDAPGLASYGRTAIAGNDIRGFHGVLRLEGGRSVLISDNSLTGNSFVNIFNTDGDGVTVERNRITFPGNGTSGDAITFLGGRALRIRHNSAFAGSCYGLWLMSRHGHQIDGALVEGNTFGDGITSGIYVSAPDDAPARDITVRDNVLANNLSWGLLTENVDGLTVEKNVFHHNLRRMVEQHRLYRTRVRRWSDNVLSEPFTLESVEQMRGYRFPYRDYRLEHGVLVN